MRKDGIRDSVDIGGASFKLATAQNSFDFGLAEHTASMAQSMIHSSIVAMQRRTLVAARTHSNAAEVFLGQGQQLP